MMEWKRSVSIAHMFPFWLTVDLAWGSYSMAAPSESEKKPPSARMIASPAQLSHL